MVFGFEQLTYSFSESVGTGNVGVRLSPESGQLTENLVFTFSTEDSSAVGECVMEFNDVAATIRHLV